MSSLPVQLTSFIGREEAIATAGAMRGRSRLMTLVGPGGSGKTRLAVELSNRWGSDFADGVWFADLSTIERGATASETAAVITAALEIKPESGTEAAAQLRSWARARHALVLLDNCEQVIDEAADLAAALASGSRMIVLATSREPLNVPGESVLRLPPLDDRDALRLLRERAEAGGGLAAADDSLTAVCRRLDGIPLALELAASLLRSTSPADLLAGLDRRFEVMHVAARGVPARHRTLEAVVASSWALLTADESTVANRLSVLNSPFSAATAAEVGGRSTATSLPRLVEASLVDAHRREQSIEYRMSETVREYGRAELDRSGEMLDTLLRAAREADGRQAHRSSLSLLSRAEVLVKPGDAREYEVLDLLAKSAERSAQYQVCLRAVTRMLERLPDDADPDDRALLFVRIGALSTMASGDLAGARHSLEHAIEIFTKTGSPRARIARNELSWVIGLGGDLPGQAEAARLVVADAEAAGDDTVLLHSLGSLTCALIFQGRFRQGVELGERGLALARSRDEAYQEGWFTAILAMGQALQGDPRGALARLGQVRERVREGLDPVFLEAQAFANYLTGNHRAVLRELAANEEAVNGFALRAAWVLDIAAASCAELGDLATARRYLERTAALYSVRALYYQSCSRPWFEGQVAWIEGDHDKAMERTRAGVDALVAMGALPVAAFALYELSCMQAAAGLTEASRASRAELRHLLGSFEGESLAAFTEESPGTEAAGLGRLGMRAYQSRALEAAGELEDAASAYEECGETWRRDRVLGEMARRGGAPSPGARLLARTAAFADLPSPELESLLDGSLPLRFRSGEVVHERWQGAVALEIVEEGSLQLFAGETVLSIAGPGDLVGERALLEGERWAGDVVAASDTTVLRLVPAAVLRFAESRPQVAERLSTLLRQRLRQEATRTGEVAPADLPARLVGAMRRVSASEGRRPPSFEILPVYLDAQGLSMLRPAGKPSWKVDTSAQSPGEQVGSDLKAAGLNADIVHSTSWRYEEGRLVLTYLAVLKDARTGDFETVPVVRADLARGSAHDAPKSIDVTQVVEHGLRHLSWLSKDDVVIKQALTPEWLELVGRYVPEPFRAL